MSLRAERLERAERVYARLSSRRLPRGAPLRAARDELWRHLVYERRQVTHEAWRDAETSRRRAAIGGAA